MIYGRKKKSRDQKKKIDGSMKMKGEKKDMEIQEIQSKGSLFDRIMYLENQLTQLSMEFEYRKTSYVSKGDASSSSGSKITERNGSYPIFDNPFATYTLIERNPLHVDINNFKSEKKSQKPHREMRHSGGVRRHPRRNGEQKTSSNTRTTSKVGAWPNLRLLGC